MKIDGFNILATSQANVETNQLKYSMFKNNLIYQLQVFCFSGFPFFFCDWTMGKRGASTTPPSAKSQKVGLAFGPWGSKINVAAQTLWLE